MTPDRPVLFYDPDCRFCRASAKAVHSLDRRHRFALLPFDDPAGETLLATVPPDLRPRSIHVVQPDGRVVSAGDAFIELFRALPGGDCLADSANRVEPLQRIFHIGYDVVSSRRGFWSRFVPDYPPPVVRPEMI